MTLEQLIELGLTEEVAKKVLGIHKDTLKDEFIPIARFNEVNEDKKDLKEQLEDRDTQLADLKEKAKGNEDLTNKITELEELNNTTKEEYEEKIKALEYENTLTDYLNNYSFTNDRVKQSIKEDMKKKEFKIEEGKLLGADDYIKVLQESEPESFKQAEGDEGPGKFSRPGGEDKSKKSGNPFAKDSFNLTEQGRLFRENPEKAIALREAVK